jgi:hypothetical protein
MERRTMKEGRKGYEEGGGGGQGRKDGQERKGGIKPFKLRMALSAIFLSANSQNPYPLRKEGHEGRK